MADIDVESSVAQLGGTNGATEFADFFEQQIRSVYLPQLIQYQNELNKCYNNTKLQNHTERLRNMTQEIKDVRAKIQDVINKLKNSGPSGKGGADIVRTKDAINAIADIERKESILQELRNKRTEIYGLRDREQLKKIAMQAMGTIYQMRAIFSDGVEEEIGVTFSQGGFVKLVHIPMSEFLKDQTIIDNISVTETALLDTIQGDPWQLSINFNTSVMNRLQQLAGPSNIKDTKVAYNEYKAMLDISNAAIYRIDPKYTVIQSGFVAEALARMVMLNEEFKYQQDRGDWYKGSDIEGQGIHMSVKNAMEGAPTLLRINSLQTVIKKLIQALSQKRINKESVQTETGAQAIVSKIRSEIFGLNDSVENYLETTLFQGFG